VTLRATASVSTPYAWAAVRRTLPPSDCDLADSGQDLIEYALIAALIALSAIAAMGSLSNKISNEFNKVGNSL